MRRLLTVVCVVGLLLTGCNLHPGEGSASADATKGQASAQKNVFSFDDLLGTKKLVMTTKAGSDMPNSWEYDDKTAKDKAAKLVPVLKTGQPLPDDQAIDTQHTVPQVIFIFSLGEEQRMVNVFADRFSFENKWYKLDNAPVATYGVVEKIEGK